MGQSERPPNSMGMEVFGRQIEVHVGLDTDEHGQFMIELLVDGVERYGAWFTDKSEESIRPKRGFAMTLVHDDGTPYSRQEMDAMRALNGRTVTVELSRPAAAFLRAAVEHMNQRKILPSDDAQALETSAWLEEIEAKTREALDA